MLKWLALAVLAASPALAGDCPDGSDPNDNLACPGDVLVEPEEVTHVVDGFEWRELTAEEIDAAAKLRNYEKVIIPPARFDYFNHKARAVAVPADMVSIVCNAMRRAPFADPPQVFACAAPSPTGCLIILPKDSPHIPAMLRHEMGHCNHWPASHPP